MSVNVYAFPPVTLTGSEWTKLIPVSRSQSIMSGKRYISAAKRKRRLAACKVQALGNGNSGAGYCEVLKELLEGGENLVRLNSWAVNWHLDSARAKGLVNAQVLNWATGGNPLDWTTSGQPLGWYTGAILNATPTTDGGWPAVTVTGCPANMIVARPADFITVFANPSDAVGVTVKVMAQATSNASGVAVIRLMEALASGGRVNLQSSETAVFEVLEMPRSMQPVAGNWSYDWAFKEAFEDEAEGGFVELNPWT